MRSSTSSSRYLWIFLAACAALVTPIYAHYLIYSPPIRDIFERTSQSPSEYFGVVGRGTTVLFRSECLAENIVDLPRLQIEDVVMTRDDSPWELVEFLEATEQPPKRIVVFEDTTFFLFYRAAGRPSETLQAVFDARRDAQVVDTLTEFLLAMEDRQARDNRQFAAQIQSAPSLARSPELLRQFASEYLDRLGRRVVPGRSRHTTHIESFWRRQYLRYYTTGDPSYLMMAFSSHRSQFIFPKFQSWLARNFTELEDFENAPVPDGFEPRGRLLAAGFPTSPAEEDRYPAIRALKKAARAGTSVRVVALPSNPHYEMASREILAPYYEALRNVALRNGWPYADIRSITDPELSGFGVFRDQMHLWHDQNEDYYEAVAKRIRRAMVQDPPARDVMRAAIGAELAFTL